MYSLQKNTVLQEVDLFMTNIDHEGAKLIADLLKRNKSIRKLELYGKYTGSKSNGTHIPTSGITLLMQALEKNTTLETLSLNNNGLDSTSATNICKMMKKNKHLSHLNLALNQFNSQDIKKLASALQSSASVRFINVRSNTVDDEEWKMLVSKIFETK